MKKLNKYTNITDPFLFVILSIFTFGIYDRIWMYRNWKYFKHTEKTDIMPFWRAWFAIFFVYSLFKKISDYSIKQGYKNNTQYSFFSIFLIISYIFIVLSESDILFMFLIFGPPFLFLTSINAINYYYEKVEQNHIERPWKWWYFILLLICFLIWVGLFL